MEMPLESMISPMQVVLFGTCYYNIEDWNDSTGVHQVRDLCRGLGEIRNHPKVGMAWFIRSDLPSRALF